MYVLDASVTLAWIFPDEADATANVAWSMLEADHAIVPCHWAVEVINALAVGQRRGRISGADAIAGLTLLSELRIEVVSFSIGTDGGSLMARAQQLSLSAYDTAYLELAARFGVPLATLDKPLKNAAAGLGVAIVGAP